MLPQNNKTGLLYTIAPPSPCPSCKAPITQDEARKQDFWRDESSKAYHCPHCAAEIEKAQSVWPALLYVAIMMMSPFIATYINTMINQHYPSGTIHWVVKGLIFGLAAMIMLYVGRWHGKYFSKPYWKLAKQ